MSAHRRKTRQARSRRTSRRGLVRTLLVTGCAPAVLAGGGAWYAYRDLAAGIGSSKALEGTAKSRSGDTNVLLQLAAKEVEDGRQLEREGREAGRRAQIETVRNFLGVPVDHFAELNLAGFHHPRARRRS